MLKHTVAIVLAGGYATRLYPLTKEVPKALLTLGRRMIIDYIASKLSKLGELGGVVVSTNRRFQRQFERWLSSRTYQGVVIEAEPSTSEADKLGAVRALKMIVEKHQAEHYLIVAGDNFFTDDLFGFVKFYCERKEPVIAVYDVRDLERVREYSAVELSREGLIVSFQEKPSQPRSALIGTCIYLLPRTCTELICKYLEEGNDPDRPGSFIQWLASKRPVYGYSLSGYWIDIGTPDAYREAQKFLKSAAKLANAI